MANVLPRHAGFVCRSCRSTVANKTLLRAYATTTDRPRTLREQFSKGRSLPSRTIDAVRPLQHVDRNGGASQRSDRDARQLVLNQIEERRVTTPERNKQDHISIPINTSDPQVVLKDIQGEVEEIGKSDRIPEDSRVAGILDQAYQFSNLLIFGQNEASGETQSKPAYSPKTTNPLLSDLDEAPTSQSSSGSYSAEMSLSYREEAALSLCKTIHQLLKDPKIYITESYLRQYVKTTCLLGRPEYLPEIFHLYAYKEIPKPRSYPIEYRKPLWWTPKYAIPMELSDMALEAAILRKDLPLCISIVDTTVGTRQFRINRLVTRASLPFLAVSTTIPISWAASDWGAHYQNSWEPDTFFWMSMAAAGSYVGTLGTIGWIAIATWNDHHKRVRWVKGTPFRFRWLHEPERLYLDKIALAWGYKKPEMWGEEVGEEWESLRELLAPRWMILDISELLPGML